MREKSSSNDTISAAETRASLALADLGWHRRILMLILNWIPFLAVGSLIMLALLPFADWPVRAGVIVATLYLVPPLLARLVRLLVTIPEGAIPVGSAAFFGWWILFQLQVIFCRFPALEELLRLMPSLYSFWLRLWGAGIGRFTYWGAGTLILDRPFLSIGDDVVLGAGIRLNPHVLNRNSHGQLELLLATVKIGNRAQVGGYSLLTAGTQIADDEVTRAFLISPPFSSWKDGKRIRERG